MQSSSFLNPLITPTGTPYSGTLRHPKPQRLSNDRLKSMAFKKDGKMVDDNMIVLRQRIRKIEAETECNDIDGQYPDNLMQWEKTYINSGGYHSDVYEAVAFLQRFLMESRPSVALGLMAVFAFGGSIGMMTVLQWLINSVHGN